MEFLCDVDCFFESTNNFITSGNNIVNKKWNVKQRKAKHSESVEHAWKADALTKASIDAMEMQILRQILLRMGARAQERES